MNPRTTRIAPGEIFQTLPLGKDALSVRRRVEAMERVMEGLFVIPGTNRKVGMDVVLDLIPSACRRSRWRGCSAMSGSTGRSG
jgi:hypothetical protein